MRLLVYSSDVCSCLGYLSSCDTAYDGRMYACVWVNVLSHCHVAECFFSECSSPLITWDRVSVSGLHPFSLYHGGDMAIIQMLWLYMNCVEGRDLFLTGLMKASMLSFESSTFNVVHRPCDLLLPLSHFINTQKTAMSMVWLTAP